MKYLITVVDNDTNERSENKVDVRKNTTMKTVVLKGVEKHVEQFAADPLNFMSEVKSLHREAYDLEDFTVWLKQDLEMSVYITDLNNRRYYNKKRDTYTTSYDEAIESYRRAWEDQCNEDDGEKVFENYLPDYDTIIEHGNELCDEEYFLEDWELEEE